MSQASPSSPHLSPICTVDVVLLTLEARRLKVALLRRGREPYANTLALPGGYIHATEDRDTRDAAQRVLRTKAGVLSPYLEQLETFSGPVRDPRGWSISVAYYALVHPQVLQGEGSASLELVDVEDLKGLPFDHALIIGTAVARLRSKSAYSSLPVHLCAEEFTLSELQAVYELVMGTSVNKVSFLRKMGELGLAQAIEGEFRRGDHRPAQLYRLRPEFRNALSLSTRAL
jgi:8-oxo-dGTP diphosphatase